MGACQDFIFTPYFTLSLGSLQLLAFIALLVWQWQHTARSRRGDLRSGLLILTPAYVWFIYALGLTLLLYAVGNIVFNTRPYISTYAWPEGVYWAVNAFVFHFVMDGIAIFFCQEGIGTTSLRRAACIAALWALFIGIGQGLAISAALWAPDGDLAYGVFVQNLTEVVSEIFYLVMAFAPLRWLRRRPAVIFYAIAWAVYRPIFVTLLNLMYRGYDASFCTYAVVSWAVWGVAKPFVLYQTLRIDSLYWQGLYTGGRWGLGTGDRSKAASVARRKISDRRRLDKRDTHAAAAAAGGMESPYASDGGESCGNEEVDIRKPLLGTSLDEEVATILAVSMDTMSRECPILPFSALSIVEGKRHRSLGSRAIAKVLGAGGTARVYEGLYENKPVAIKMIFCMMLVPETIANFARENALLCSIRHPNIVQVEGICVVPPCISSVMELCSCSLYELLQQEEAHYYDWGSRLSLAIDCANAVACLHARGIVHMDLKSSNFLVGQERVSTWTLQDVKLWLDTEDLSEFKSDFAARNIRGWGASMRNPGLLQLTDDYLRRIIAPRRQANRERFQTLLTKVKELQDAAARHAEEKAVVKLTDLELSLREKREEAIRTGQTAAALPVGGMSPVLVPQTVNWTAPEVLRDGADARTTAADVYSLAMTLYEVLTGQVPFADLEYPTATIAEQICQGGKRPFLPPRTDRAYASLLRHAWAQDPAARPTAAAIRDELSRMRRQWYVNRTLAQGRFGEGQEAAVTRGSESPDGASAPPDVTPGKEGGALLLAHLQPTDAGPATITSAPPMGGSPEPGQASSFRGGGAAGTQGGSFRSQRSGSTRSRGSSRGSSVDEDGAAAEGAVGAPRPRRTSEIAFNRAAMEARRSAPASERRRAWLPVSSEHECSSVVGSLAEDPAAATTRQKAGFMPLRRGQRRRSHTRSVSESAIQLDSGEYFALMPGEEDDSTIAPPAAADTANSAC